MRTISISIGLWFKLMKGLRRRGEGIRESGGFLLCNPAKNKVVLEVYGFQPGPIQVQIVNLNGKAERNDQRLLANGNETMVVMFCLPAGIYFVVLTQNDKQVRKKMAVQ